MGVAGGPTCRRLLATGSTSSYGTLRELEQGLTSTLPDIINSPQTGSRIQSALQVWSVLGTWHFTHMPHTLHDGMSLQAGALRQLGCATVA